MDIYFYLFAIVLFGCVLLIFILREKASSKLQGEKDYWSKKISEQELYHASEKGALQSKILTLEERLSAFVTLKSEHQELTQQLLASERLLATTVAENQALQVRLQEQKQEIEEMGKKLNLEFELIANRILDSKSQKFTDLNKDNLKNILDPLGKNITEFKSKVEEAYLNEAKERHTLTEKIKDLEGLNRQISQEAQNLTNALKGQAKTQGRWGEMILESILEKSGLVKDREYFLEHQLKDEEGNNLISEQEGKKKRPDVVLHLPEDRAVIIDAKVSLVAFIRSTEASSQEAQQLELDLHVAAVKNHIDTLSKRDYDEYRKSLDFVIMFIPNEPAYIAAMQKDPNLWEYAYEKRILLLSPTNLITSLKLIVDLWKREYQSRNAIKIAERGQRMYDKFVSFVEKLKKLGEQINASQKSYEEAFGQLSSGKGNLIQQSAQLHELGVKAKKKMDKDLTLLASESDEEVQQD